jgi:hypothetical protein
MDAPSPAVAVFSTAATPERMPGSGPTSSVTQNVVSATSASSLSARHSSTNRLGSSKLATAMVTTAASAKRGR